MEHTIEGLFAEIASVRGRLRALVQQSPALDGAGRESADLMQRQMETMERQCALVRGQLAQLRTDLTGGSPARTSPAARTEESDEGQRSGGPDAA
jgi:hypothetical protein